MRTEILPKATAELQKEIATDLATEDKDIAELLEDKKEDNESTKDSNE